MKFALFQGQTLLFKGRGDKQDLHSFLKEKNIDFCIVSSVRSAEIDGLEAVLNCPVIHLSHSTSIPISNNYKTKETLGDDRLANAVAADALYPGVPMLIIDCGTCVKFDFVSPDSSYLGGSISPGLQMRFKALNHFTGLLPKLEPFSNPKLIGDSTDSAIVSGVVNGMTAEIKGMIESYSAIYENLTVILTGGDASFFDKELKSNIFVEPNLTLIGLNEILRYNSSH